MMDATGMHGNKKCIPNTRYTYDMRWWRWMAVAAAGTMHKSGTGIGMEDG